MSDPTQPSRRRFVHQVLSAGALGATAAGTVRAADAGADRPPPAETSDLRAGRNYIPTPVFTAEEDGRILKMFAGLRVADVSDGMDRAGLQDIGLVDPAIVPLWRDTEHFTHRMIGIAVTARYVPTSRPPAGRRRLYERLGLEPDDSVK